MARLKLIHLKLKGRDWLYNFSSDWSYDFFPTSGKKVLSTSSLADVFPAKTSPLAN